MYKSISLLSSFSVAFALTKGARISLAHLIEFSHFVDLYVLENEFCLSDASVNGLLPFFLEDTDSPFRFINDVDKFDTTILTIDFLTLRIYDAAPVNHTFSTNSYEFWLNVSSRNEVPSSRPYGKDFNSRSGLLFESQELHNNIEHALELAASSNTTLIPSTRNLIPFLSVFHEFDTPALRIYRSLAAAHHVEVNDVMTLLRPRSVYIPPLLSVLLARCENRDDLIPRLIELRSELSDFRSSMSEWLNHLDGTRKLKDKIEIAQELRSATDTLTKKYTSERRIGVYKELAGAFIDAAEDGNLTKMVTKPTFALLKRGITELAPELLSTRRFTGIVQLMDEAFEAPDQRLQLSRIFGDDLDISQKELSEAKLYQNNLVTKYGISLPQPG